MSTSQVWNLQQDLVLQSELDRVTDAAIEKIIERKITPEKGGKGYNAERARLKLARATPNDQASIEALFAKLPVRFSGMELLYDRSPDFFSLLKARGNASTAISARLGSSEELWGLGSISLREGYFNQQKARVAYLGDLRMLLSRSTARVWRQLYSRLLQDVASELGVSGFLTAIVGDNKAALRSLVTRQNSEFTYEPLGRVRLLAILGRRSLLSNGRKKLEAERILIGAAAEAEFSRFYSERSPSMRHGWIETPKAGTAVVLKNRRGETKVVARLVSPDAMKRMRIQDVDWKTRALLRATGAHSFLRATGAQSLSTGATVSTTYLSWVCFGSTMTPVEKRHALIELIDVCLEYEPLKEMGLVNWMLVVPDTIGLSMRELGGRFHYSTPVEIFEVRPDSIQASPDLRQQVLQDVGFEMSLI